MKIHILIGQALNTEGRCDIEPVNLTINKGHLCITMNQATETSVNESMAGMFNYCHYLTLLV